MVTRMMWPNICRSPEYSGRWVALDNVRYDPSTALPLEADVVDVDDDLADLCARMRESDRHACAILFVDDDSLGSPISRWPAQASRAAHH